VYILVLRWILIFDISNALGAATGSVLHFMILFRQKTGLFRIYPLEMGTFHELQNMSYRNSSNSLKEESCWHPMLLLLAAGYRVVFLYFGAF